MKVRAKSIVKLTDGRIHLDCSFDAGMELEKLLETLLLQLGFEFGKDSVMELAKRVAEQVPNVK